MKRQLIVGVMGGGDASAEDSQSAYRKDRNANRMRMSLAAPPQSSDLPCW